MNAVNTDFQSELSGLFSRVPSRTGCVVNIDRPELPHSIPPGTTCKVEPLRPREARFYDLVVVHEASKARLRRVLRQSTDGVLLCGDEYDDIPTTFYDGPLQKVVEASHNGTKLEISRTAGFGVRFRWIVSMVKGFLSLLS